MILDELERLAREAEREAATSDKCDAWDTFAINMADSAPLLFAVVRAAEEVERLSHVHGVETVKDVAMDALRDALSALKGAT